MADMNAQFISEAVAAREALDLKYNEADFASKLQLKPQRDAAYEKVAALEDQLVASGATISQDDLDKMRAIRADVAKAANIQALISVAVNLVAAVGKAVA